MRAPCVRDFATIVMQALVGVGARGSVGHELIAGVTHG